MFVSVVVEQMSHRSYRPVLPTGNKLLQKKWDQTYYDEHRRLVGILCCPCAPVYVASFTGPYLASFPGPYIFSLVPRSLYI